MLASSSANGFCLRFFVNISKRLFVRIGTCEVTLGVIPVSLLVMHVIVVTHLLSCIEVEKIVLFFS